MKKHILIFGAGKSATALIDYLKNLLSENNWSLTVADSNLELAIAKTGAVPGTYAKAIDVLNNDERSTLIMQSDLVISLLPPALHFIVASDCCRYDKHLLTASYLSAELRSLAPEIEKKELLFLCEMGLDPGIDHLSAMEIIDRLKSKNAVIHSFASHCGGLVAPESDDNPWHYKISWNSANVVKAGIGGAVFKQAGKEVFLPYESLFDNTLSIDIPGLGTYAYYANRDSLSYIKTYGLEQTSNFLRTTLRHPDFCSGWKAIVKSGLTCESPINNNGHLSFKEWSGSITSYLNAGNKSQFEYLGLFDESLIPSHLKTSASVLQYLLDKSLMLGKHDKDMVVMLHEFIYNLSGSSYRLTSSLVIKGEDNLHTAMAKTVGLPLGIAAKLLLQGKLKLRGLHIPVTKEIYEPVLEELKRESISFIESVERL